MLIALVWFSGCSFPIGITSSNHTGSYFMRLLASPLNGVGRSHVQYGEGSVTFPTRN